jgi:hypothetical protein
MIVALRDRAASHASSFESWRSLIAARISVIRRFVPAWSTSQRSPLPPSCGAKARS